MRILFFKSQLNGGGSERVLNIIANELAYKGYDVHIATKTIKDKPFQWCSTIKFHDLNYRKPTTNIQLIRNICGFVRLIKGIRAITREVNPDVVISFNTGLNAIVIYALVSTKVPIIISEHFNFNHKLQQESKYVFFQRNVVNRFADAVIVLTRYDKVYTRFYLNNTIHIPNPIAFSPLTSAACSDLEKKRNNILLCGRLSEWNTIKGFDRAIEAFKKIADKYPEVNIDIAGSGNENDITAIQQYISQIGLTGRVHLLGFCKDMSLLYQTHKLFVMSSRYEGFSLVIAEAMSMGCLPISFDVIAGPNEIILDKIDGLLVKNHDIVALAEAMDWALSHDEERVQMIKNGLINVKRFSPMYIILKWEELFQRVIKK